MTQGRSLFSKIIPPISIFPVISNFDKMSIAILSDEFNCLFVFFVFIAAFAMKLLYYSTRRIIRTLCTGFIILFLEAAHLDLTFGLSNVSFAAFVS